MIKLFSKPQLWYTKLLSCPSSTCRTCSTLIFHVEPIKKNSPCKQDKKRLRNAQQMKNAGAKHAKLPISILNKQISDVPCNIPQSINRRLSEISYDKESFDKAAPFYQKALDSSGYKHLLTFSSNTPTQTSNSKSKNRRRDIIWYNPPFSKNVSTNIGRTFLKLLDAEFPKEHVLHKIFNRNTVKISYSCMPNLKQNIDGHNKSILHKKIVPPRSCNCRMKTECPMSGNCHKESVV